MIIPNLMLAIMISCNTNSSNSGSFYSQVPLTEEQLKDQLQMKECSYATDYIEGKLGYEPIYKNALSMKVKGLKLTCTIKSNAALATIKDIKAQVSFKSKTGAVILERTFDIYEFIEPNDVFTYKTNISISNQQYKDISDFSWNVIEAHCK